MRMPITYAINDSYTKPLMAQLVALYEHAKAETVYDLYILNYRLKEENRILITNLVCELKSEANVTFLDISDDKYEKIPVFGDWPKEVNFRGYLPSFLSDFSKILYLDADTLVLEDLTHLMDINLDGYLYAASGDNLVNSHNVLNIAQVENNWKVLPSILSFGYINSGVLLMNLAYWREHDLQSQFFHLLQVLKQKNVYCLPDQDVLNYLAIQTGEEKIYPLPATYNLRSQLVLHKKASGMHIDFDAQSSNAYMFLYAYFYHHNRTLKHTSASLITDRVVVLHFVGIKPWHSNRLNDNYYTIFKPYADRVGLNIPPLKKRYQNANFRIIKHSMLGKNIYKLHRKIKLAILLSLLLGFIIGYVS